ncbi:MAG: hypothetical protein KBS72_00265 [Bacteroidales bacterium]|nr:hypothetical protein [Candidatus Cacconaster scatequi]
MKKIITIALILIPVIMTAQTTEFKRPKITGIVHIGIFTEKAVSGTPSPSTYGLPLRYDGDMTPLLY